MKNSSNSFTGCDQIISSGAGKGFTQFHKNRKDCGPRSSSALRDTRVHHEEGEQVLYLSTACPPPSRPARQAAATWTATAAVSPAQVSSGEDLPWLSRTLCHRRLLSQRG
ncbi:hypothetical protein GN956_G11543 [Arapaima gigas]